MPWPSVSIIIPVFNNKDGLEMTLGALARQRYAGPIQVVVVDNGSQSPAFPLGQHYPNVLFLNEPRVGSYAARNTGVAASSGEILAFIDADCVADPQWVRCGVEKLLAGARTGLVGGRIDMVRSSDDLPELFDYVTSFPQEYSLRFRGYSVTANLFTTRAVFDEVGPFNASIRSGGDREWSTRVRRHGYRLIYENDAVVCHPARRTRNEIEARVRRIEAGIRDRAPSWCDCILEVLKCLCLPVAAVFMTCFRRGRSLSPASKARVLIFAYRMRVYRARERLRLQFTNEPSPRS